jgi:hypothetical protein
VRNLVRLWLGVPARGVDGRGVIVCQVGAEDVRVVVGIEGDGVGVCVFGLLLITEDELLKRLPELLFARLILRQLLLRLLYKGPV